MPNYLNRPVSSGIRNTYQSQFVPLPLEQFARAASYAQGKQDEYTLGLENQDDANFKLKGVVDSDNEKLSEIRKGFHEAATSLAGVDLSQRDNQKAARDLVRGIAKDKDLERINYNYAQHQEYLKLHEEMAKGGNYQAYNDEYLQQLEDYDKKGGYKSGKLLNPIIHKYEDTRPVQEKYFNDMGESGADALRQAGEVYYKDGWKGISEGRVNARAKQAFDSYAGTTAAAQDVREYNYLKKNGSIPKGMDAQEFVFKRFLDAGLERVHGVSSSDRASALNKDKEDKSLWNNILSTETPSTLTGGMKIEFDDKGQVKGSGKSWGELWKESSNPGDFISKLFTDTRQSSEEEKAFKHINLGAKLNGVTPQEYASIYDTTSHMKVEKPLVGKALRDNTQALFNGGAGIWSSLNVMNTTTGERNMNFLTAIEKLADEKGFDVPDPNEKPEEFSKLLKTMGVSITGEANPNEFSTKPIIFTVGENSFAADMSFGGKVNPYKTEAENQKALELANLDRLNKGQQVVEKDSKGNDIIYYKDIKTGKITHKLVKELK